MYVPLKYTAIAKYPKLWFFDQLVFVDILIPIVATSFTVETLALHCLCIPFYVISFMCIYEVGYFENDMKAAKAEAAPVLKSKALEFADYHLEPYAWLYAIALAMVGGGIAAYAHILYGATLWIRSGLWLLLLILVRAIFYAYNNRSVDKRPYLYLLLQACKYGSVLTIFPPTAFGAILTGSQIVTMSVIYWIYRLDGRKESINRETMRFSFAFGFGIPLVLGNVRGTNDTALAALLVVTWLIARLTKPIFSAVLHR